MINSNFLRPKIRVLLLLFMLGGFLFGPSALSAQTVFGLSSNTLVQFDAAAPETVTSVGAITGISNDLSVACLDFRPATGQLYALAYNNTSGMAQLYTINTATAVATAIGTAPVMLTPGMGTIAMDFNPVVDRVRVVGGNNANFRLHPVTGAVVATDGSLVFAANDPNNSADPAVGACAYTNSYIGTTATTLINFDEGLNLFCTQIPPNNGVLNTIGFSGLLIDLLNPVTDFDISFNAVTKTNVGLFVANLVATGGGSTLCTVNLANGLCTPVALVGTAGTLIEDIAVMIPPPTTASVTGQLAFALTSAGTLISFDTDFPTDVRSQVTLSGLAMGQVMVGMDFRPATATLMGLGYNATTSECMLYNIDVMNGVCTPVGTAPFILNLGSGAQVGFDFNPTVDRIRLVAANNVNVRLNPITGGIAATDTNLAFATTDVNAGVNPSVGGAAYTNSFSGTTTTQLFVTDDSLNVLCLQTPPNNGTLNTIGSLGIVGNLADLSTDLDIYFDFNTSMNIAYGVANVAGSVQDALYSFNTATGAFTIKGGIGLGIAVRDLAIMIDSIPVPFSATVFGLSSNNLVTFDAAAPATVTTIGAITGVNTDLSLACLDFRPATGQLYALAYNNTSGMAQLYTINTTTAVATAIGAAPVMLTPGMGTIAMDFNPVVDRIRVVGGNNANFRLHPVTGAVVATDGSLAFAATDINSAVDPAVGACAYTNSYIGTTATTLINFDEGLNLFCTQIPPNNGVLNTIGVSGLVIDPINPVTDFDITFDTITKKNVGLFVANLATGGGGSSLCSVNLTNGICIPVGLVGAAGTLIQDIAVLVPAPSIAALEGQLAYALTTVGTMISFDTEAPSVVRSQVTLSGLATGQVIVGMDFRPATGTLMGLGYNATTMECSLYNINVENGVCTPVNATPFMLNLGSGTQVGFDFNPTVDRIRVVAANNVNVRLNPNTGAIAATDVNLAFAATDVNAGVNASVGGAAYTNSFLGATSTQLFVTDDSLNVLCLQMPPNDGVLNTVGSLGIVGNLADLSTDLDIYYDHETSTNIAFGVANVAGSVQDALYTFSTTSGAFSLKGNIGLGIAVRDLAIFIDSIPPVSVFEPLVLDASFEASPNPAVDQTTFQFDLKTPGQVQIIVTDIIGRHTTVVVDKELSTGPNAVEWVISGRNSGYYLAQLWVNGQLTGTQKLIIR